MKRRRERREKRPRCIHGELEGECIKNQKCPVPGVLPQVPSLPPRIDLGARNARTCPRCRGIRFALLEEEHNILGEKRRVLRARCTQCGNEILVFSITKW